MAEVYGIGIFDSVWINEQVKIHQPPLRLRGEGWGEGISNLYLLIHL